MTKKYKFKSSVGDSWSWAENIKNLKVDSNIYRDTSFSDTCIALKCYQDDISLFSCDKSDLVSLVVVVTGSYITK